MNETNEIESTKSVWLDGVEYIRVFYVDSDYFDDVLASGYDTWLETR